MTDMTEEERRKLIEYEQYQKQKMKKEKKIRGELSYYCYYVLLICYKNILNIFIDLLKF